MMEMIKYDGVVGVVLTCAVMAVKECGHSGAIDARVPNIISTITSE